MSLGVLISFYDEFAKRFGIADFDQPKSLMLQYVAPAFGDMGAGICSNYIKSRKKTMLGFYVIMAIFFALFFLTKGVGNAQNMYLLCMGLGLVLEYLSFYKTLCAGQFGTNLRASAAISIPNMVRGLLPLILLLFKFLRSEKFLNDYVNAAWVTGVIVIMTRFISVLYTRKTMAANSITSRNNRYAGVLYILG